MTTAQPEETWGELDPADYAKLPALARERLAVLEEHTGYPPRVFRLEAGYRKQDAGYRIIVTSERVELVMSWRSIPRTDRWKYRSTLRVDGAPVALAQDMEELAGVFHDPDAPRDSKAKVKLAEQRDAHIPDLGAPAGELPAVVHAHYEAAVARNRPSGALVQLGLSGDEWQILVTTAVPDSFSVSDMAGRPIQMYTGYRPDAHGHYAPVPGQMRVILAIDGKDITDKMSELSLEDLGLAAATTPAAPPSAPPVRTSAPGGSNAVLVRRASVNRT